MFEPLHIVICLTLLGWIHFEPFQAFTCMSVILGGKWLTLLGHTATCSCIKHYKTFHFGYSFKNSAQIRRTCVALPCVPQRGTLELRGDRPTVAAVNLCIHDGNAETPGASPNASARHPCCQSDSSSEIQLKMSPLLHVCEEDASPWIWFICQKPQQFSPKKYQDTTLKDTFLGLPQQPYSPGSSW